MPKSKLKTPNDGAAAIWKSLISWARRYCKNRGSNMIYLGDLEDYRNDQIIRAAKREGGLGRK